MFLHLLNIPGILQSLVSFLIVFMLEMFNSFPQILNGLQLRLAVLDENLEVFQSRDNFLHERSDLLRPMVVNQVLKLLQSHSGLTSEFSSVWSHLANVSRDIVNINNVDILIFALPAGHTAGPLSSSVHTRFLVTSFLKLQTIGMNYLN